MPSDPPHGLRRRDLLRQGLAATLSVGALPFAAAAAPASEGARVRRYTTLGRTGLRVCDIGFGSSRSEDPDLVRYAFDLGVNYFDTAEGYRSGRSESAIGEALHARRSEVVIASKVSTRPDTPRADLMRALEGSLRRLRTDWIDVYFNHAVNDVGRLTNPEWLEFTAAAKKQGKIRWIGMSGHGGRLVECLDHALDHDQVDVILVAHNFGQDPAFYEKLTRTMDFVATQPDLPRVLARAHEKKVGVVAMKTLMGARLNDMRPYERGGTFAQAAFRWVLSGPHVDSLVVSMTSRPQIDEYLAASGAAPPGAAELRLLDRYLVANGERYCRHGCDDCAGACPYGVPISDVLRARMYAVDYGDTALARETFAGLGAAASACLGCSGAPCLGACPHGLTIAPLTRDAQLRLG
jgi:predicted aldo/keto reductase-like oxidoreductase